MSKVNKKMIIAVGTILVVVLAVIFGINIYTKNTSKESKDQTNNENAVVSSQVETNDDESANAGKSEEAKKTDKNDTNTASEDGNKNSGKTKSKSTTENNKSLKENKPKNENTSNKSSDSKSKSSTQSSARGDDFSAWNASCSPELVVVNKDNELPSNFNLNLVTPSGIECNGTVHSAMVSNLQKMFSDAKSKGLNLYVSSGYRSVSLQQNLFNNKVNYFLKKGYSRAQAEIEAAKIVARPRTSEHNSGLAIDLNGVRDDFYTTKEYKWLMENAANYGFILRYSKEKTHITNVIYEPWHFRYVGLEHARAMKENNMCLEEYIKSLHKK